MLIEKNASFFEVAVAMGFLYFAENNVDIAIIETGLGGRLDATNIIQPQVSVITNIGMDHTAILGDNLEDIAREKAGIIKFQIPVVIGSAEGDVKNRHLVYAQLQALNSLLEKAGLSAKNTVVIENKKSNEEQEFNELINMLNGDGKKENEEDNEKEE